MVAPLSFPSLDDKHPIVFVAVAELSSEEIRELKLQLVMPVPLSRPKSLYVNFACTIKLFKICESSSLSLVCTTKIQILANVQY